MSEKVKTGLSAFFKGFTVFHAIGLICIFLGFFVGDTPDIIVKRSDKLVLEARDILKGCTTFDKATRKKICFMPVDDLQSLAAATRSLGEDAKKIIGSKGEINVAGARVPFQVTGAQVLGFFIFFTDALKAVLRSRFGKGNN